MSIMETLKCRIISRGQAKGEALVSSDPISFLGGVDPLTGLVIDSKHELNGKNIKDKILIIPGGKGSTVGSYVIFQMAKSKTAPKAIVCLKAEPIIATGAIMAEIPMVDQIDGDIMSLVSSGMEIEVDAEKGEIKIL
jgi:predicted aconitase with swiveling domain